MHLFPQRQADTIEAERVRSAVTCSVITATQERCRLGGTTDAPDALDNTQIMGQAIKGQFFRQLPT